MKNFFLKCSYTTKRFIGCFFLFFVAYQSESFGKESASLTDKPFKVYVVCWTGENDLSKGFKNYWKTRNINVELIIRDCNQDRKICHALVDEIRSAKPDLVFTLGTPTCEEIGGKIDAPNKQDYIWDIPIVSVAVTDPISSKLIYSLEKTGRNITGVNHIPPVSSHIEAMKSYVSNLKSIAALYNPSESNSQVIVNELKKQIAGTQIQLHDHPLELDENKNPTTESIKAEIEKIATEGSDFIYIPPDNSLSTAIETVVEEANKHRLLTFATIELQFIKEIKPLMGLISHFFDVGLFGGYKAEQILVKKMKPEEIPYEKLKEFSFVISQKTFKEIKSIPPLTVLRIAEIIQDTHHKE